jgi:hypothetical protein
MLQNQGPKLIEGFIWIQNPTAAGRNRLFSGAVGVGENLVSWDR